MGVCQKPCTGLRFRKVIFGNDAKFKIFAFSNLFDFQELNLEHFHQNAYLHQVPKVQFAGAYPLWKKTLTSRPMVRIHCVGVRTTK